jgi:LysR family transcriptional regulator, glycine cleavage system transcriptional activator
MRRDVPSLSLLQAFEAAARHRSFSRAAEELRVSQSAISRHVRTLEEQLGVALVNRTTRRFSLTTVGEAYFPEVRGSLDRIESSTRQVLAHRKGVGTLNLATMPTFGAKWLVPRMPGFIEKYPGIRISFFIRTEPFEFSGTEFDAGISFGTPTWPNVVAERLMGEELVAVSNPALARQLARSGPEAMIERIARCRLLHLSPLMEAWPRWFESSGMRPSLNGTALQFENFAMCIEAAASGLGIALVPYFLVLEDIRLGRLSIPHAHTIRTNIAYFIVYPASKRNLPAVRSFAEWVLAAAAATEAECDAALAAASG